jgi:hypothetical protein
MFIFPATAMTFLACVTRAVACDNPKFWIWKISLLSAFSVIFVTVEVINLGTVNLHILFLKKHNRHVAVYLHPRIICTLTVNKGAGVAQSV